VAVVAGSGLDLTGLLDRVNWEKPFEAFKGLSATSVSGHSGVFTLGSCADVDVILQQGRRHMYEGLTFEKTTASVRALVSLGVDRIIFTNAAGGLKPAMNPGMLLAVERIMTWPYRAWPERPEELVPDWVMPGSDAAGVYVWVHGPSYETRAEIAVLQRVKASAVGMSTAPEVAAAQALGLRTAAISCITNNCCEVKHLSHEDVLATARNASERLCEVLARALPRYAELS
jgi:purine-nucleoside phosphorylase